MSRVDSPEKSAAGRAALLALSAWTAAGGAARWRQGDRVPFVLHFAHSPAVHVTAVVVRPRS